MKGKKIHYGVWVAVGCFLIMFYAMGMTFNLASLFLSNMVSERGFSQSQISNAMTLQSVVSLLCIFFLGKIYARYSTRKVVAVCSLAGVIAYICFSQDSLFMCYLGAAFVGVTHGGAALVPVSILVTSWFQKYRGVVLSWCMIGSSGANVVCSKIVAVILNRWGLGTASLIHASAILLLCVIAMALIRDEPADVGLKAFGQGEVPTVESSRREHGAEKPAPKEESHTDFITMAAAMFMVGAVITPLNGFYPTFLQSIGYETLFLGSAASIFGITMIFGKLSVGVVIDGLELRLASVLLYVLPIAALISALLVTTNPISATIFVALWGLGNPIGTVPLPLWTQRVFGTADYKLIYSRLLAVFTMGSTVGFFLIGKMADLFHSYHVFFLMDLVFISVSFALLMRLLSRHQNKTK